MKSGGCCPKEGLKRGAWTSQEDKILTDYINAHGLGRWRSLPANADLNRCGKSCRLRWLNYLRPDIKRGNITEEEEELIVRLHKLLGNRWSLIAGRLPGRTDNEVKNYWNTYLRKKVSGEIPEQRSSPRGKIVSTETPSRGPRLASDLFLDVNPHSNISKDETRIQELMQNSIFSQVYKDSSYTSTESLQNICDAGISFNEDKYIRGLFDGGIREGEGLLYPVLDPYSWDTLVNLPQKI